jgi:hypothetical protein
MTSTLTTIRTIMGIATITSIMTTIIILTLIVIRMSLTCLATISSGPRSSMARY